MRRSSKYVVFLWRQSYFTHGDLHSCGLKSHAIQLRSSKYVVFLERQPYFPYGDLRSSGLKIHAFQFFGPAQGQNKDKSVPIAC